MAGTRLSKYRRADTPPGHVLTDRDMAIVAAVAEHKLLSRSQIQRLLGFGAVWRANFRLIRLFQHGYLARHYLPTVKGSSQAIYGLDTEGVPVAAERLGKDPECFWRPKRELKPLFLAHQLAVNDVRIAFELAARSHDDHALMEWRSEEAAKDRCFFGTDWHTLTPDAFGRYRAGRQVLSCFLEVDMGTMPGRRFREKVDRYVAYAASGRYAERYRSQHFRVLVVANSPGRLANLRRATAAVTQRFFWFTTLDRIREQGVIAPVWETVDGRESSVLFARARAEVHA